MTFDELCFDVASRPESGVDASQAYRVLTLAFAVMISQSVSGFWSLLSQGIEEATQELA